MSLLNAQVRATVAVSDIAQAAEFYETTLGLSPLPTGGMDQVRIYPCGEGSLLQVYASEHAGTPPLRSLAGAPPTSSRSSRN